MTAPTATADRFYDHALTVSGYCVVILAISAGWWYADLDLYTAQAGTGYWLGIIGSLMMLALLLYPLRKRAKALRQLGPVKHWFRAHMILGVLGPTLIVFHSNFQLGSLNATVALFSMLIVAASGLVGRYFYGKLHYGIYGARASLTSLEGDLEALRDSSNLPRTLLPLLNEELTTWEANALEEARSTHGAIWHAVKVAFVARAQNKRLRRRIRLVLAHTRKVDPTLSATQAAESQHDAETLVTRRLSLLRRLAQYTAFERLFSWWHIVHYPLFLMLVVAAIVHVVAVHMY